MSNKFIYYVLHVIYYVYNRFDFLDSQYRRKRMLILESTIKYHGKCRKDQRRGTVQGLAHGPSLVTTTAQRLVKVQGHLGTGPGPNICRLDQIGWWQQLMATVEPHAMLVTWHTLRFKCSISSTPASWQSLGHSDDSVAQLFEFVVVKSCRVARCAVEVAIRRGRTRRLHALVLTYGKLMLVDDPSHTP